MKLLAILLSLTSLSLNFWLFTQMANQQTTIDKLYTFAASSSVYYDMIDEDIDCLFAKQGMDTNDIFLAAQGKTRRHLVGTPMEKHLPVRDILDLEIPECERVAERRGWIVPYGPWQE